MNTINQKILQDIDEQDAKTQFKLGKQYYLGEGMSRSYALAARCFSAAASGGDAAAQYWLGKMYDEGKIKERNESWCRQQVQNWYYKSAEQNFADAQLAFGKICLEGESGVEKDVGDAYKWFALAAAQGSEEAKRRLDELENEMSPKEMAEAQLSAVNKWHSMHKNAAK